MKRIFSPLLIILFYSCSNPSNKFYMPAEWEHQDAVWFGWEDESTQYYPVVVNAIKTLMPLVQIKLVAKSESLLLFAKDFLYKNQIDTSRIKFYTIPGDRYWIRDHG